MLPYRLTQTSREAMASPSLSMEKGAYRMRAPRRRADTLRPAIIRPKPAASSPPGGITTYTALLIVLLTTAAISSFGTAYYLFTTRWDTRVVYTQQTNHQDLKAVRDETNSTHERFLSYLPHSGFHNQRIAFENALVLSRLLNRTLLVPPVRLANKSLPYARFEVLSKRLSLSTHNSPYCATVPKYMLTPPECYPWINLSWEWFVDLSPIKLRQRLLHLPNASPRWVQDHLQIPRSDIYTMPDAHRYHYRFLDTTIDTPSIVHHKFQETSQTSQLHLRTERLIQLGTLFGTSRLLLRIPEHIRIRGEIRRSMAFANPHLVQAADSIAKELGGGDYLGVHIRLGDGQFKLDRRANARQIWWNLVNGIMRLSVNDTLVLERRLRKLTYPETVMPPPPGIFNFSTTTNISLSIKGSLTPSCRGRRYTSSLLQPLNIPLFISTDAAHPLTDPTIALFRTTFPCTFFLSDFTHLTAPLGKLREGKDGGTLKVHLLPFLDAMVVGKASVAVGTKGSTFSQFIQDVLWRTYHGQEIVQRG